MKRKKARAIREEHENRGRGVVAPAERRSFERSARGQALLSGFMLAIAARAPAEAASQALAVLAVGVLFNATSYWYRSRVMLKTDLKREDEWRRRIALRSSVLQVAFAVTVILGEYLLWVEYGQQFASQTAIVLIVTASCGIVVYLGTSTLVLLRPKLFLSNFANGIGTLGAALMLMCSAGGIVALLAPRAGAVLYGVVGLATVTRLLFVHAGTQSDTYLSPLQRRVVEGITAEGLLAALSARSPTLEHEITALKLLKSLRNQPEVERLIAARLAKKYRRSTLLSTAIGGTLVWLLVASAEALLEVVVQTKVGDWLCSHGMTWLCRAG